MKMFQPCDVPNQNIRTHSAYWFTSRQDKVKLRLSEIILKQNCFSVNTNPGLKIFSFLIWNLPRGTLLYE